MTVRSALALSAFVLAPLLAASPAEAALKVTGKPKVSFFAEGSPGALDIEGKGAVLALADDGTTLTFTVPWDSITTGIDLRDDHMKNKYLQVSQFPTVSLAVPKAEVKLPADGSAATTGTVTGQFTAHGVTRPVQVNYTINLTKAGYRVVARFNYNVSEHGIEVPSYLGVTVSAAQRAEVVFDMADG